MNKIICPIDFSATSLNAIEFAVEIGKKFHSHITLFHVFTERDFNSVVGKEFVGKSFKELMAMANGKLKKLADAINEENGGLVTCKTQFELGELTDQLRKAVKDGQYDLLMMGTTGVSRTNGVFFGSYTEEAIEEIKIPMICIPLEARFTGLKKIVYASDFMKEDKIAIQEVISLATLFDARISVLHINLGEDDSEYQKFIGNFKSFIQYEKIGFVNKSFKENIGLGIQEHMNEENGDLLVVFKKHRSFVEGIFHKSLTKILSYSTDSPLFVLKLDSHYD